MNNLNPSSKNSISDSEIHVSGNFHQGDVIYQNTYIQGQTVTIPRQLTSQIPTQAKHILGRDAELDKINTLLAQNTTTVLVNGIGGIGKTSVATKYIVTQGSAYKHLAWLTVQSSVLDAFTNNETLLNALHITQKVKELIVGQQAVAAFDWVMHQLSSLDAVLVVLDNANDLADLLEFKNYFDKSSCRFLITSRTRPQEWAVVPIEHLPEDEAVRLFKNIAPSVQEADETLKMLLSKLFYHTLLIELVAKAVNSAGLTFEELQTMIDMQFIHNETLNEELLATGKHGDSLPENAKRANIENYIWMIFKEVKGLDDKSKEILRAIVLLPLAKAYTRDELKAHCAIWAIDNIVPTLTLLVERGWLDNEQVAGQKPHYKMHPLIADVVKKHLEVSVAYADTYIKRVADLIDYDNNDPKHNLFLINQSKPLAERLSDLFFEENTEGVSELLNNIATLEENFGFYYKSAEYSERSLAIAQTIFDTNHETIAVRQNNLATVYKELGKYDQAAALLESALASAKQNFGNDDPDVAPYQSNLATVYKELGKYDQAAALLESALASEKQNFGNDHPTVAVYQSNLGDVYLALGKYNEAAVLLETALASAKQNFGNDHPTVAVSQSTLASVYLALGKCNEAAALLESALASEKQNFGNDHPTVAIRQNNLAWVYYETGRKDEAKTLWQAAYQNCLKNLGAEHPYTNMAKQNAEM